MVEIENRSLLLVIISYVQRFPELLARSQRSDGSFGYLELASDRGVSHSYVGVGVSVGKVLAMQA